MFLTTEPILAGRKYSALRVIFATVTLRSTSSIQADEKEWERVIGDALARLESKAIGLGADGVIGIQLSRVYGAYSSGTVMGTAIKF